MFVDEAEITLCASISFLGLCEDRLLEGQLGGEGGPVVAVVLHGDAFSLRVQQEDVLHLRAGLLHQQRFEPYRQRDNAIEVVATSRSDRSPLPDPIR
jgi:hypothetical protein